MKKGLFMTKNKIPPKNKGGRPPIWTSVPVLQKLIDNYFKSEKKPTLAGLACSLDIDRSTLYAYEKKDKFSHTLKDARRRIIEIYEELLIYHSHPVGVIFALKNTGWRDRQDIDHTTKGEKLKVGVVSYETTKKVKKVKADGK